MEYPTIFGFDEWSGRDHIADIFPGVEQSFSWDRGAETSAARGVGICGTPQQWAEGCLTTDPLPTINPETGIYFCCGEAALLLVGGHDCSGPGLVFPSFVTPVGGEGHGGTLGGLPPVSTFGGEGHGGPVTSSVAAAALGGEGHGGPVTSSVAAAALGGEGHGGISSQPGITFQHAVGAQGGIVGGGAGLSVVLSVAVANDFVVVFVECNTVAIPLVITDSRGSTWQQIGGYQNNGVGGTLSAWFARVAVTGGDTITASSATSTPAAIIAAEYRGVRSVTPIDASAANSQTIQTGTLTSSTVGLSGFHECVVGAHGQLGAYTSNASGPGQNRRFNLLSTALVPGITVDDDLAPIGPRAFVWNVVAVAPIAYNMLVVSLRTGS